MTEHTVDNPLVSGPSKLTNWTTKCAMNQNPAHMPVGKS